MHTCCPLKSFGQVNHHKEEHSVKLKQPHILQNILSPFVLVTEHHSLYTPQSSRVHIHNNYVTRQCAFHYQKVLEK